MNTSGLSTAQAQENLRKYGVNELPSKSSSTVLGLLFTQFKNILTLLLIGAALLSFVVGDMLDGVLILIILCLNVGLGFWQEYKASKEIEALRKLEVLSTRVIRDGKQIEIFAKEIVPDDIIVIEAGDKIPADAVLIESFALMVNEASLTGESAPVAKTTKENENEIYFGTSVTSGRGKAKVVKTGKNTRFGSIALTLSAVEEEDTPLELSIRSLASKLGVLAVIVAVLAFAIEFWHGEKIIDAFFSSIALMVAAVPESLPTVFTIVLAIGVHRMYKRKALIRRMSAIESLGAATVICTDKTGTLTKNEMSVQRVESGMSKALLQMKNDEWLLKCAVLCNSASLVLREEPENDRKKYDVLGDTTEGALLVWAKDGGHDPELMRSEGKLVEEKPFNLATRLMSVVWEEKGNHILYVKGAPEVVLSLCKLSKDQLDKQTKKTQELASGGLRVLAFAKKEVKGKGDAKEEDLTFLGLIGIADTIREEAKLAIAQAKKAGIRVVMITGDNELTARAVAEQLNLIGKDEEVLNGKQLDELTDEELDQRIYNIRVFARVVPEHKLRIIQSFQRHKEVVTVTGDGVNDSLALKQAHVGVAMGVTGTDVAKEASDMIVLDDNFATIVSAIEQGRLVYNNLVKVVRFLVAGNLSELLLIVLAIIIGLPIPLIPTQILWINFVTDGLPALALAADPASHNVMHSKPRDKNEGFLNPHTLKFVIGSGLIISLTILAAFYMTLTYIDLPTARSVAFVLMVVMQMVMVFMISKNKSIFANKYLFLSVALVLLLQGLIMGVPQLQDIFKIELNF